MKVRTALLALLLLDLAAAATWFAGRYGHGQPAELRLFLVWALPGLVFVCGLLARAGMGSAAARSAARTATGMQPRLRLPGIPLPPLPPVKPALPLPVVSAKAPPQRTPPAKWTRLSLWIGVAIAVDLAPIGIGQSLGWLTFTYGDQQLAASRASTALWALPLLTLIMMRFYERTLRGQLFRGAEQSWGTAAAWTLTLVCGTALAFPTIAPGFSWSAPSFVAAALVTALAREIGSVVLFRASGLVAAGLFRGGLAFIDFYLIADWLSPAFPSANYVTSGDSFYLLRAASPLVAALLLARFLPPMRELPAPMATHPDPAA